MNLLLQLVVALIAIAAASTFAKKGPVLGLLVAHRDDAEVRVESNGQVGQRVKGGANSGARGRKLKGDKEGSKGSSTATGALPGSSTGALPGSSTGASKGTSTGSEGTTTAGKEASSTGALPGSSTGASKGTSTGSEGTTTAGGKGGSSKGSSKGSDDTTVSDCTTLSIFINTNDISDNAIFSESGYATNFDVYSVESQAVIASWYEQVSYVNRGGTDGVGAGLLLWSGGESAISFSGALSQSGLVITGGTGVYACAAGVIETIRLAGTRAFLDVNYCLTC